MLAEAKAASLPGFELLERVFGEQYRTNAETGELEAVPSKEISARNVQSPNDPEATYRNKNGEDVRGYTLNVTETCDNEDMATTASGKQTSKVKKSNIRKLCLKGQTAVTKHHIRPYEAAEREDFRSGLIH